MQQLENAVWSSPLRHGRGENESGFSEANKFCRGNVVRAADGKNLKQSDNKTSRG